MVKLASYDMFGCIDLLVACWLLFFTGLPDLTGNMVARCLVGYAICGYAHKNFVLSMHIKAGWVFYSQKKHVFILQNLTMCKIKPFWIYWLRSISRTAHDSLKYCQICSICLTSKTLNKENAVIIEKITNFCFQLQKTFKGKELFICKSSAT